MANKKRKKNNSNNKKMLIFIIFIFIISIMIGKIYDTQNKENEIKNISEITTASIENTSKNTNKDNNKNAIKKETEKIPEISVYTIDGNIDVYKRKIDKTYDVSDDIENIKKETSLSKISDNDIIRIDLLENLPKKMSIEKVYITGGTVNIEKVPTMEKEKGIIDFTNEYIKDKNINEMIYNITYISNDKSTFLYSIRIGMDKKENQNIPKKDEEKPENINILTEDEKIYYDEYIKEKDENVLLEIEPLSVAKFYMQAEIDKNYDLGYSLWVSYNGDDKNKTKYLNLRKMMDINDTNALKSIQSSSFTKIDENNGYVQYDNDKKLLLRKNDRGIWKILFI